MGGTGGDVASRATLERLAQTILDQQPDPAVKVRLLRDVLRVSPSHPGLTQARRAARANPWVELLGKEQRIDGGWGRFHSQDSRSSAPVPTTEFAVERAVALGVSSRHPVLQRVMPYLQGLLHGSIPFPDPAERNDRWPTGTRLFVAATLSLVRPSARALRPVADLWLEILRRTFVYGAYDHGAETRAHRILTGASIRGSYLVLNGKYQLCLLASRAEEIPNDLQRVWLRWLIQHPDGIRYLSVPLAAHRRPHTPGAWDRWLSSLEHMVRFPASGPILRPALSWLCGLRGGNGFWDFGARPARSAVVPLSANWQTPAARQQDWTTRVLCLLASYHQHEGVV